MAVPSDTEIAIREDDPRRPEIAALLQRHLDLMQAQSPPESVHALDVSGLCIPEITFWSVSEGGQAVACGALKELDPTHGEIKSMHTAEARRGRGLGRALVAHIIAVARRRGYVRLSLETGSMSSFAPARALYTRFGFVVCLPFGSYREDPNSAFMTLDLSIPSESL